MKWVIFKNGVERHEQKELCTKFREIAEYAASSAFEEPERSIFYRKALGIRRYYENCELCEYSGRALYPSGKTKVIPRNSDGANAPSEISSDDTKICRR